ncbi:MAG: hypothetical protein WKF36_09940 [Candidatus Nitrosocosmicus sp.]
MAEIPMIKPAAKSTPKVIILTNGVKIDSKDCPKITISSCNPGSGASIVISVFQF